MHKELSNPIMQLLLHPPQFIFDRNVYKVERQKGRRARKIERNKIEREEMRGNF